ncbi:Site-specific DNA recombinase [Roseovarius nanhaiticus]|uniref:Site-specific DNA recombinase n=1 Tax=Roseovarius nanhaiticus TaxID=573024 RepID=A0A1N7HID4_9RHOB|nr:recombinase family protein [Roseovarius nanhaiticus]SEK92154.1 Site-specific DNA recombinase [Roseovarius nanhaiticus]SIS24646.1 Site-specific DNA recombinase [Roseovarius nanhaiticus]
MDFAEKYISYIRVSTDRQGKSGLGLEAQKTVVDRFVTQSGGQLINEYVEVESGKRNSRKQLLYALEECKQEGATLIIAKLDRLARNVHFISGLIESGVPFRAVDMPEANRFVLHIMAAVAEHEGRAISERTKAALAAAKARGVKLGKSCQALADLKIADADAYSDKLGPVIKQHKANGLSVRKIADRLNFDKVPSYTAGQWHPSTVQRVWKRYADRNHTTIGNIPNPPCQT